MRRGITRAEMIILILVLIVAISPLLAEGGFARLLFESIDTSNVDPGIMATARLGMLIAMICGLVSILRRKQ